MQSNDNPFPQAGNNFRTVAHVQTNLELAVVVLELAFTVLDDDCTYEELAEDYAVAMAAFQRQLDAGEQCTGTVPRDDGTAGINQSGESSANYPQQSKQSEYIRDQEHKQLAINELRNLLDKAEASGISQMSMGEIRERARKRAGL